MNEFWRNIRRALEDVAYNRGSVWKATAVYAVFGAVVGAGLAIFPVVVLKTPVPNILNDVVMFALCCAIPAAVFHIWNRDWKPLKAWVRPHHIVKLVLAVAVVAVAGALWWRFGSPLASAQHPAPASPYPV